MSKPRRIYLLSPEALSPETIAVTFAKTSRSPKAFDEIAAELTDERSAEFHEKWVVGYGHASVAEHAVLHVAIENVSRLAIEAIEGNRLASFTEKSTRYQQWEQDAFHVPLELEDHDLREAFMDVCGKLFQIYQESIPRVQAWLRGSLPQNADETDSAYERRLRSGAVDICRFLLPAASLANVGVTINARALEYAICKMLSSPLLEVQQVGEQLCNVGKKQTPTLIKYAACNKFLIQTRSSLVDYGQKLTPVNAFDDFKLISWSRDGQDQILAALLFRFGHHLDFKACHDHIQSLSTEQKKGLIDRLLANRGKFDQPPREFEYAQMTCEAIMDQGAYFEFKRHRMMTQTAQKLTPSLGFAIPFGIKASGCEKNYLDAMRAAALLYERLASYNLDVASYIIPNGYNRRVLFSLNLREAFNLCRLRAAHNAHFSIRRVAMRLVECIHQIYPLLGSHLDVPGEENWEDIEKQHFSEVAAT